MQFSFFYHKDDGLCVHTLTLKDTKADHTSLNIEYIILETLHNFQIPLSHALLCVVDDANNMTKTVQLLSEKLGTKMQSDFETELTVLEDFLLTRTLKK